MSAVFSHFFFQPLTPQQFSGHFGLHLKHTDEEIDELYERYLYNYHHNAYLFYCSQFERHRKLVFSAFQEEYGIDASEDHYPDEYEQEQWEVFATKFGLWEHHATVQLAGETANRAADTYHRRFSNLYGHYRMAGEIADQLAREMELISPSDDAIAEIWFNTTINNPKQVQRELQRLPYAQYLQTEHWQKVRAAMLMLHRARCQEENCWLSGDSWYGGNWETDIHVHHLDYRNRGNERFRDLTLLCKHHHEQWHAHEADPASPAVKFYKTLSNV